MFYKYLIKSNCEYRQFENSLKELKPNDLVYFDVEANSLDPYTGKLILIQLKFNDKIYIINTLELNDKAERIAWLLKNLNVKVVGHNVGFDLKYLYTNSGILLENVYDTMLVESIITGGLSLYSKYKDLVKKYVNKTIEKETREDFVNFGGRITNEMLLYSALDVEYLSEIYRQQNDKILETNQERILDLEMKLLPVVVSMELNGVTLNKEKWLANVDNVVHLQRETKEKLLEIIWRETRLDKFENGLALCDYYLIKKDTKTIKAKKYLSSITNQTMLRELFYERFNTSSHAQIKRVMQLLGIGVESTGEKVLKEYLKKGEPTEIQKEFINLLLDYRGYSKLLSSYGYNFIDKINPVTGKVHANFNQIGTQTGRFSSSNPNLQQIPRSAEYRECFSGSKDYKVLTIDYSQQELRLAASLTNEKEMITTFLNGVDAHKDTASKVFNVPFDEVQKEQRQIAKSVNFAVLYGTTAYGLAYNLDMTKQKAEKLLGDYFNAYPTLKTFKDYYEEKVIENYYAVTYLGRRRNFKKKELFIDSRDADKYFARLKREGFNHFIQGTGADMLKLAMVLIYYNNPFGNKLRFLMQVHDEVVIELHRDILVEGRQYVEKQFEEAGKEFYGEIPVEYSAEVADTWVK